MYMLGMEEALGVRQNIYLGVVLNYETKSKRNETKRNEILRNATKYTKMRNETQRNETKFTIMQNEIK